MNLKRIEAAMIRRVGELETALLTGKSLPPQDGDWRTGDLMILITVAAKVLRDHKGEGDELDVEGFLKDV